MRLTLLIVALIISISLSAQQYLTFTKADSSETVSINKKDFVKLGYKGYMGQLQEFEGIVSNITDSTITLSPRKKLLAKLKHSQVLMVNDITGFRKYSGFRRPGEVIYGVVAVALTGTVTAIVSSVSIPAILSFLSAAGTGAVTAFMKGLFFSTRIKNTLGNGWNMQLHNQ